jgi:hypothetical protein
MNEPERRTNKDGTRVVFWALAALVYAAYIGLAVTISPTLLVAALLAVIPASRLTSHEATAGLGIGLGSGWTVGVLSMGPRLDEQGFVQAMMMAVAAAYTAQMLVLASRQERRSWWWEIGMVVGFGIWLAWVKYTMGPLPFPVKP